METKEGSKQIVFKSTKLVKTILNYFFFTVPCKRPFDVKLGLFGNLTKDMSILELRLVCSFFDKIIMILLGSVNVSMHKLLILKEVTTEKRYEQWLKNVKIMTMTIDESVYHLWERTKAYTKWEESLLDYEKILETTKNLLSLTIVYMKDLVDNLTFRGTSETLSSLKNFVFYDMCESGLFMEDNDVIFSAKNLTHLDNFDLMRTPSNISQTKTLVIPNAKNVLMFQNVGPEIRKHLFQSRPFATSLLREPITKEPVFDQHLQSIMIPYEYVAKVSKFPRNLKTLTVTMDDRDCPYDTSWYPILDSSILPDGIENIIYLIVGKTMTSNTQHQFSLWFRCERDSEMSRLVDLKILGNVSFFSNSGQGSVRNLWPPNVTNICISSDLEFEGLTQWKFEKLSTFVVLSSSPCNLDLKTIMPHLVYLKLPFCSEGKFTFGNKIGYLEINLDMFINVWDRIPASVVNLVVLSNNRDVNKEKLKLTKMPETVRSLVVSNIDDWIEEGRYLFGDNIEILTNIETPCIVKTALPKKIQWILCGYGIEFNYGVRPEGLKVKQLDSTFDMESKKNMAEYKRVNYLNFMDRLNKPKTANK